MGAPEQTPWPSRLGWSAVLVVLLTTFVVAENYLGPTFHKCIGEISREQTAESPHQHSLVFLDFFWRQGVCSLSLIDRHNGFFAFLGAIAIAGFTFVLWRATDGMLRTTRDQRRDLERSVKAAEDAAAAATLNAQAAIGVELPRLELNSAEIDYGFTAQSALEEGDITIGFMNHGRTAAHIIEECVESRFGPVHISLPETPRYTFVGTRKAPFGTVVASGERHFISCEGRTHIQPADARAIYNGTVPLWLYGYVAYRDFLGGYWRTKFCLAFKSGPGGARFEEADYPAYAGRERYDPNARAKESG